MSIRRCRQSGDRDWHRRTRAVPRPAPSRRGVSSQSRTPAVNPHTSIPATWNAGRLVARAGAGRSPGWRDRRGRRSAPAPPCSTSSGSTGRDLARLPPPRDDRRDDVAARRDPQLGQTSRAPRRRPGRVRSPRPPRAARRRPVRRRSGRCRRRGTPADRRGCACRRCAASAARRARRRLRRTAPAPPLRADLRRRPAAGRVNGTSIDIARRVDERLQPRRSVACGSLTSARAGTSRCRRASCRGARVRAPG